MKKIIFTKHELNKFLLLGDNNSYFIDKQNPLIRAFKRKDYLAIFCTIRIKKKTTTIKLGNYPIDSIEEIYAKFSVAQKIANSGNNPNFIFKNNSITPGLDEFNINNFSFNDLLEIFLRKKNISEKYQVNLSNTLRRNFANEFLNPVNRFNKKFLTSKVDKLIKEGKKGTANNLLNYFLTLCNFGVRQENFSFKEDIIKAYNQTKEIKKRKNELLKPLINTNKQRVKNKINKLSNENLVLIEKQINKLL